MGILVSACFFLIMGIMAAGNGDFSVLAAIGKGVGTIAIILFIMWLMTMHPLGFAALIIGLIIFIVICNKNK